MRLTCPNCGAQYEVPDEVIPEEGRDVQCSNCENTWFQAKHPDQPEPEAVEPVAEEEAAPQQDTAEPEPEPTPEPTVEIKPAPKPEPIPEPEAASEPDAPAETGKIDPAVASILKEEAAREADLRAKEGGSLETQPDLALDTPPEPDTDRAIKELTASETAADAGRKEELPDVEAINSSLRSDAGPSKPEVEDLTPRKTGGGFLRGFALIIIVGIILLLIYSNAQQINEAVPQAEPVLQPYVSLVDQARLWLEGQASGAAQN